MFTSTSRGMDSFRTLPKAEWTSMIVSERPGPACVSSIESPLRTSEPSTRMLLPLNRLPLLESARSVAGDTPGRVCALIRKRTSERSSQLPIAMATHLTTRPMVMSRAPRGALGPSPSSRCRESRFRSASRSPPPARGLRRAR